MIPAIIDIPANAKYVLSQRSERLALPFGENQSVSRFISFTSYDEANAISVRDLRHVDGLSPSAVTGS
jgi:hypothetical protein